MSRFSDDNPGSPALPATSRSAAIALGAVLFAGGSLLTLAATIAPGSSDADVTGAWIVIGCTATIAAILWFGRHNLPFWTVHVGILVGIVLITVGIYINGERHGGPAALNEIYYVWPVIYAAYYFRMWALLIQIAVVGVCYAIVLVIVDPGAIAVTRWLIVMTMLLGVGSLINMLRTRVDQLVARLADAARRDPLTGLLNRRGFDERLDSELARAERATEKRSIALVIGDVDHFKEVNDRFGHPAGDAALSRVAEVLAGVGRRIDTVARLGGEEFAFIVPDTDAPNALELAERARLAVERAFAGEPIPLTVSLGVVASPDDGETAELLLAKADKALYAAKHAGRNRAARSPVAGETS